MTAKNFTLSLLVATTIFLAPVNLFIKWHEAQAYVGGIFVDYLVQKFWLGEVPLLLTLIIWLVGKIPNLSKKILPFLKKNIGWLALLILIGWRQTWSPLPDASMWYDLKLIQWFLFGWCVWEKWPQLHQRLIRYAVLAAVVFQAVIATLQFWQQQPLFNYQVLGETQFTGTINIAHGIFKTGEKILPYGTTAHPNIVAGVIVVMGAWWLQTKAQHQKKLGWKELTIVALISWVVFITQSLSALAAWLLFLLWQNWPWLRNHAATIALGALIVLPSALLFAPERFQTESFFRRNFLNAHAVSVIVDRPFFGAGLNMFTTTLESLTGPQANQFIRFIQPAHHVPLLWLAETGLIGIVIIWLGLKKLLASENGLWLLVLVPLLSLDHYLITQWVGGVLLVLMIALQTRKQAKS